MPRAKITLKDGSEMEVNVTTAELHRLMGERDIQVKRLDGERVASPNASWLYRDSKKPGAKA